LFQAAFVKYPGGKHLGASHLLRVSANMIRLTQRQLLIAAILAALAISLSSIEMNHRLGMLVVAAAGVVAMFLSDAGGGHDRDSIPRLRDAVKRLRQGKRVTTPAQASPELAALYEDFGELADLLEDAEKSSGNAKLATEVATAMSDTVRALAESVSVVLEAGDQTTRNVRQLAGALKDIGQHVEVLAASAEESSSSILQMTATNDEVAENIQELASSVRETVASIEEMAFSIKEVAKNVDALSLTAEETSSSMNEMDVSIDQVQSNANETARLSEEVAQDAERGAEAILKTIGEIYRIKESSQEAVAVISNLGSRIDAIGQILNVIDDVAEQTNLLALNAAIIAAQAGEHGKGFAVVADEIKDLAERAGASTKEIADLIKTIQAESKNAIQAVERGAMNVDRGVEVSNEAERALKKILESSQKSTNMVRAIARATVEQAKGSKQVTDAIGRIAETVQQIAAATGQQARGSELIMSSGEKMRTIAQQVERSTQEQTKGGRRITSNIENINSMVTQLNNSHRQHTQSTELVIASAARIETAVERQQSTVRDLNGYVDRLKRG
jgi:methyl-accepting chemotaxis protein